MVLPLLVNGIENTLSISFGSAGIDFIVRCFWQFPSKVGFSFWEKVYYVCQKLLQNRFFVGVSFECESYKWMLFDRRRFLFPDFTGKLSYPHINEQQNDSTLLADNVCSGIELVNSSFRAN